MSEGKVQEVANQFEGSEMLPAVYEDQLPEVSEEAWKEVLEIADNIVTWAKPVTGGFKIGENDIRSELSGVIISINPYLVKWTNNVPDKIANVVDDAEIPLGYERRCDVVFAREDGRRYGISLAKSSFIFKFCPYIKDLAAVGWKPHEIVTRFRTEEVKGKEGKTFTVVIPSPAGQLKPKANVEEFGDGADEDVPF